MSEFYKENSLLSPEILSKNFPTVFNRLNSYISELPQIENFVCIGEVSILHDDQNYFYEVHCRLNKTEKDEETELLFKDVTRTKIREKETAENKNKSLFFSKVIHEFKNPLICLCELVIQTQDIIWNSRKKRKLFSNLEQINSLANYLQILIKDFTYLTESQYRPIADYERNEIDLNSVIDFCSRIGKTLLKKCNKNEVVEFKVNIDQDVPNKIVTDEWKLKQILINLLSNSIKFTSNGSVTIDVSLDEEINFFSIHKNLNDEKNSLPSKRIKFLVKDTGPGMNEEVFEDLSRPFKKESSMNFKNKNNEFGSGLGLSIANEISSKLGSGLECASQLGEGTSFWFYIPVKNKKINLLEKKHSSKSIRTLKSYKELDIVKEKKSDYELKTHLSKFSLTNKSFTTKEHLDIKLVKPEGIYIDYLESSSEEITENIILNKNNSFKSISRKNENDTSISFEVKYFIIFKF
jgi:signal transduction histidine kinase